MYLSSEVFKNGSHVNGSTRTKTLSVTTFLQEPRDPTNRELKASFDRFWNGLLAVSTSSSSSTFGCLCRCLHCYRELKRIERYWDAGSNGSVFWEGTETGERDLKGMDRGCLGIYSGVWHVGDPRRFGFEIRMGGEIATGWRSWVFEIGKWKWEFGFGLVCGWGMWVVGFAMLAIRGDNCWCEFIAENFKVMINMRVCEYLNNHKLIFFGPWRFINQYKYY